MSNRLNIATLPPLAQVRMMLRYDPEVGRLKWRVGGKRRSQIAGSMGTRGYRQISIDGRAIPEHVVIWALEHGAWPTHEIDHRDRDKLHNQPDNLRPATRSQQMGNSKRPTTNTSGFRGVERSGRKWRARIRVGGRLIGLGTFDTPEQAAAAYNAAAVEAWGEYANPARA
jgi:hypothetical protein